MDNDVSAGDHLVQAVFVDAPVQIVNSSLSRNESQIAYNPPAPKSFPEGCHIIALSLLTDLPFTLQFRLLYTVHISGGGLSHGCQVAYS